eukprot:TRINITY_DN692_c0_g1_i1.p1 TRINITY_DN692_c0_g1~~TRINITY_DN692_c0_g1_i1.p1  ORF type:complete len:235 (+),score=64.10 TRINITY_DN692_c0_g1_i1:489-1193(+)
MQKHQKKKKRPPIERELTTALKSTDLVAPSIKMPSSIARYSSRANSNLRWISSKVLEGNGLIPSMINARKKKERRYWPSQSSGPVIEDACDCEKCIPNNCSNNLAVNNTDEDFSSSPSTEEVEYENQMPSQMGHLSHHQMQQLQHMQQMGQICLQPQYVDSQNNPQQVVYIMQPHPSYYTNPTMLKSSNDFNGGTQYLKSSNDFMSHQRPWGDYLPSNSSEYTTDGFFVENNFL